MKYFNCINSDLKVCKLFNKLLDREELREVERKSSLRHLSRFGEVIKLNNHAVCAFSVGVNVKLCIGRKDSVQYLFGLNSGLKGLEGLMKSCLLNGSMEDFIKAASYENNLIRTLFSLISSRVKSWLINRVTKIDIINLNHYQFIEQRKGTNYITLALFISANNGLGGFMRCKDEDFKDCNFSFLDDEHLIASYIDEFIREKS